MGNECNTTQIVYALTNAAMPGLVKIGKTTQSDVSLRLSQLYSTGVPVPFECIYAVQVEDCSKVESALHIAFGPNRINPSREFFQIEPEQAIAVLKLLGPNEATSEINSQLDATVTRAEKESSKKLTKRPNLNFYEMGLHTGEILTSVEYPEVTVTIQDAKKVELNGEIMSLTAATRKVLGLDYSVQPSPKWFYNGRLLKDIYDENYSDE